MTTLLRGVLWITLGLALLDGCDRRPADTSDGTRSAELAAERAKKSAEDAKGYASAAQKFSEASENNAVDAERAARPRDPTPSRQEPSSPTPLKTAIVNFKTDRKNAILRAGPSKNTEQVGYVPRGEVVTVLGPWLMDADDGRWKWYRISYKGQVGWIHENSLERD